VLKLGEHSGGSVVGKAGAVEGYRCSGLPLGRDDTQNVQGSPAIFQSRGRTPFSAA
jgi:hypothetical protein